MNFNKVLGTNLKLLRLKFFSFIKMENNLIDMSEEVDVNKLHSPQIIKEQTTEILVPPGKRVFYNPVQEFNRDLSVLVLQIYSKKYQEKNVRENGNVQKPFRILEALSATGLRSIRYAKEIPNVTEVVANDISSEAVESIKANIKHNNVENLVTASHSNAVVLMANNTNFKDRFQVVDLDPYGSPSQFLDTAVQCVADGGLLLVTCTDLSVLCGLYPETCFGRYGALSYKSQGIHEMALRIVLQCIQSHAAKYKRCIEPLLCVSVDFYIRLFIKINTSPKSCKEIFSKLSMIYECTGCGSRVLHPFGEVKKGEDESKTRYSIPRMPKVGGDCIHCGESQLMGGPIWNEPLYDLQFIEDLINSEEIKNFATSKRLVGMLTLIREELHDVPLYYLTSTLCKKIKTTEIPFLTLRSAILNAGYRVSISHAARNSLKTDAPMDFIWDLFKTWKKEITKESQNSPRSAGDKILTTAIQNKIDFSERPDANPLSRKLGLLRYQKNPAPYWGPGKRASVKTVGGPDQSAKKMATEEHFKVNTENEDK